MKTYVSQKYHWGKETIDINYDTINNYTIESKNYLCLFNESDKPSMCSVEMLSYFTASDEKGVGLCTVDNRGISNTTYYEDEEWCGVFFGLSSYDGYYDDFSKLEDVKNIINYNISVINRKNDNCKILSEIPNVKILDEENNLVGVAKECYVNKTVDNSYEITLNKIITNNLSKMNLKKILIELDGVNYCIWNRFSDYGLFVSVEDGLVKVKTKEYGSTPIYIEKNDFVENIDINYEYDDSSLDITNFDVFNFSNDKYESTEERKNGLKEFNKHYSYAFKKEINIVKYLLS